VKNIFFISIFIAVLLSCKEGEKNRSALPYLGPVEVTSEGDSVYHKIPPFSFVNQDGQIVNDNDLAGKIYVADFFFTTCDNICPKMTKQMYRVQEAFRNDPDVMLLSHTVDPETDSVHVLARYAEDMKADTKKWHFLTGGKKELYDIAYNGYFLTVLEAPEEAGGDDDFIHSETLILVDPEKHIRGLYDGTNSSDVDRLIRDIKILRQEVSEGRTKEK
jgi:protein SCO1